MQNWCEKNLIFRIFLIFSQRYKTFKAFFLFDSPFHNCFQVYFLFYPLHWTAFACGENLLPEMMLSWDCSLNELRKASASSRFKITFWRHRMLVAMLLQLYGKMSVLSQLNRGISCAAWDGFNPGLQWQPETYDWPFCVRKASFDSLNQKAIKDAWQGFRKQHTTFR